MTEAPFIDAGPRSGPDDALVLDIGEGVGALVLYTDEAVVGTEIEVGVGDIASARTHTLVKRRRVNGREIFAGVYPALPEGQWHVFGIDDRPIATVTIRSGCVTEVIGGTCRGGVRSGA